MKKRTFDRNSLQHFCQRSADGSVIFYSLSDYLVFITIFFKYCRDLRITPRILCIMRNHFHFNAFLRNEQFGARLMMLVCGKYARQYNSRPGVVKIRFKEGFSRSEKQTVLDMKSCDIYIGNNPVRKKQCGHAFDYRWNLLKYCDGGFPWSEPLVKRAMSKKMKRALAVVDDTFKRGHFLTYNQLDSVFCRLQPEEADSFADYVIAKYSTLDYGSLFKEFGSKDGYVLSMNNIVGNDYDIEDDCSREDYRHYDRMDAALARYGLRGNMERLRDLPPDRFANLVKWLMGLSCASPFELARYLHVPKEKVLAAARLPIQNVPFF